MDDDAQLNSPPVYSDDFAHKSQVARSPQLCTKFIFPTHSFCNVHEIERAVIHSVSQSRWLFVAVLVACECPKRSDECGRIIIVVVVGGWTNIIVPTRRWGWWLQSSRPPLLTLPQRKSSNLSSFDVSKIKQERVSYWRLAMINFCEQQHHLLGTCAVCHVN